MSRHEPQPPKTKDVLATSGHPLDPALRGEMESRFGRDFSLVRIHTDARANESAEEVSANAYTVGSHVVFGRGQFQPHTSVGRHLLAHELTHTIQQSSRPVLQRQAIDGAVETPAEAEAEQTADEVTATPAGFIVDDDAGDVAAGQMRKSEFLDELSRAACDAADAVLAQGGWSTEGCLYLEQAFASYRSRTAAQLEARVRRYIEPEGVTAARDYIPRLSRRVAEGVTRWMAAGDMSAVPPELASELAERSGDTGSAPDGAAGRMLFKRTAAGTATDQETARAASQLDRGTPLEGPVRSRMERAFGHDFSAVRIHNGPRAAAAASSLGARAFTVGNEVAFGGSEYQPDTPIGDALIAHELAHVVQQSGGVETKGSSSDTLDDDADRSAVGVVMNLWTGVKHVASSAIPRLRSGLRLQRCKAEKLTGDQLVAEFGKQFADAAKLAKADKGAMTLVEEAAAAGARYGGYAEDGPGKVAWPYTVGSTVYVPKARTDAVLAMNAFLFELNNAQRESKFSENTKKAAKKEIDAKTFARRIVELEVEGMLRMGQIWIDMKKDDKTLDKYDAYFYLAEYNDYKAGKKTKDQIVDDVLQRRKPHQGNITTEQFYMDQYPK